MRFIPWLPLLFVLAFGGFAWAGDDDLYFAQRSVEEMAIMCADCAAIGMGYEILEEYGLLTDEMPQPDFLPYAPLLMVIAQETGPLEAVQSRSAARMVSIIEMSENMQELLQFTSKSGPACLSLTRYLMRSEKYGGYFD